MVLEELVLENYRPGCEQSKEVAVRNAKVSSLPGMGRIFADKIGEAPLNVLI